MKTKYCLLKLSKSAAVFFLLFLFNISCKTIAVQEKWAFSTSTYNQSQLYKNVESLVDSEQKKAEIDSILSTKKDFQFEKNGVFIHRGFFQINDLITLEYFVFQPQNPIKTGIFCMGNGSNIFDFVNQLSTLSSETQSRVFTLHYRGYGNSEGLPSFRTQFTDNQIFINSILKEKTSLDFVIGYSLGSVFGSHLAVENNVKKLYLLAPFSNTPELFNYFKKQNTKGFKILFRPFLKFTADEYLMQVSNTEKLKIYKGELLIIHGKEDRQLPYFMGKNLYELANTNSKELVSIEGGHWSPMTLNNWKILVDNLKNL
jgi:uncharacterized protein